VFLATWCAHCAAGRDWKPAVLGHECDGRYLQTAPADSPMLVARFEAKVGEAAGEVALALPFVTIEPLIQKLRTELQPPAEVLAAPLPPATAGRAAWNPAFDDVRVALNAQLPGPQITARELPRLQVGDVLPLPAEAANLVHLRVGGTARFSGRLGTQDSHWAVEVLHVLKV
jgi:flagellar motor switch protein FliM